MPEEIKVSKVRTVTIATNYSTLGGDHILSYLETETQSRQESIAEPSVISYERLAEEVELQEGFVRNTRLDAAYQRYIMRVLSGGLAIGAVVSLGLGKLDTAGELALASVASGGAGEAFYRFPQNNQNRQRAAAAVKKLSLLKSLIRDKDEAEL